MKNVKLKRLIVLVPAMLVALFLLNAFIPKHKERADNATNGTTVNKKPVLVNLILKSDDAGESWKDISKTPPKIERTASERFLVKLEGVAIATNRTGIMRSADDGKHWQSVINASGGGIAVASIKGGFTAITHNAATRANEIHMSLDKGKTWQSIDKGLPTSISSIQQMGKYLIAGHMGGLFRSADMGKTWKRIRCGIIIQKETGFFQSYIVPRAEPQYVLSLYVAGNVLYAVSKPAGC